MCIRDRLFIGVIIGSIIWSQYSVAIVFLAVSIFALYEFYKLMNTAGFTPHKITGLLCGITIYGLLALHSFNWLPLHTLSIIFPLLVVIVIVELFRKQKYPISNIAFTVLSMIYIVMPLASLNYFAYYNPFNDEVHLYKNCLLYTSDAADE